MILCRGQQGDIRYWDSAENVHEARHPVALDRPGIRRGARRRSPKRARLAAKVAEALDYVGVLTLEFFATEHGPVFNEMAPRVHNSGHWTIEGALTSQFENHIRAICGLPLGDTALAAQGRR